MASAKIKVTRYFFWLMTLAVMAFIFMMSSQNAEVSSANSEGLIFNLLNTFYQKFRDMSDGEKLSFIETVHAPIRTAAHGIVYCALGFSMFSAMCTYAIGWGAKFGVTIPFCIVYAASDEYHQTFVSGRSAQFQDLIVDTVGALIGISVVFIFVLVYRAAKNGGKKMRKKELMRRLTELVSTVDSLAKENKELKDELNALREQLADKKEPVTEPFASDEDVTETVEEKPCDDVCFVVKTIDEIDFDDKESGEELEDDMLEYGAGIIGEITVDAARCCEIITSAGGPNVKDQLSLIMGKSELVKGEILAIALSDYPSDKKREMIAAELDDAKIYFKSVCEQNKEI